MPKCEVIYARALTNAVLLQTFPGTFYGILCAVKNLLKKKDAMISVFFLWMDD